jgi:hypothetical protein
LIWIRRRIEAVEKGGQEGLEEAGDDITNTTIAHCCTSTLCIAFDLRSFPAWSSNDRERYLNQVIATTLLQ